MTSTRIFIEVIEKVFVAVSLLLGNVINCCIDKHYSTLHLHMLVWVKDISATRAYLLHASVPNHLLGTLL